jgi:hypothetical protein
VEAQRVDLDANADVQSVIEVAHYHDEVPVPMVEIGESVHTTDHVGAERTVMGFGRTFECPQCRTRVGLGLETTVDVSVTSRDGSPVHLARGKG